MTTLQTVYSEIELSVTLAKCQKCGCLRETLESFAATLPTVNNDDAHGLQTHIAPWVQHLRPTQYSCLGCEHCYPAIAQNAFAELFPSIAPATLTCDFKVAEDWPVVVGEYFVLDKTASVAISTLASIDLAQTIADEKPEGLALVGKTETENIGIDKVIKNIVANPAIRHLIISGKDSAGHQSGQTFIALKQNGVDENMRVIGSIGKRPILRNVSIEEINKFREQVQVINMIGCEEPEAIYTRVSELASQSNNGCGCGHCTDEPKSASLNVPTVAAVSPSAESIKLDKAGYFVILPLVEKKVINVEHYSYDNKLLRVIEGDEARAMYHTIINEGWVTELSHAAYLGKELAKAQLALTHGLNYVQDGA